MRYVKYLIAVMVIVMGNAIHAETLKKVDSELYWDKTLNAWVEYNKKKNYVTWYFPDKKKAAEGAVFVSKQISDNEIEYLKKGKWIYYYPTGEVYSVETYNDTGKRDGAQLAYYPNKQVSYRIPMDNDKKEGKAYLYDEDGNVCREETWENGKLISFNNIKIISQTLQKPDAVDPKAHYDEKAGMWGYIDPKTGEYTGWYINGEKKIDSTVKNNLLEGYTVLWFKNGNKMSEGLMKKNKDEGVWTFYNEDGSLSHKTEYKDGIKTKTMKEGWPDKYSNIPEDAVWDEIAKEWARVDFDKKHKWTYNIKGVKTSEGDIKIIGKEFVKNGKWTYWDENGKLKMILSYKDNKADGESLFYGGEKKPKYRFVFKDGELVSKEELK